jgi:PEP-CTERM motif
MKLRSPLILISSLIATTIASGQGTFQNLDFEEAGLYVSPTAVGTWGDFVDPALAFPGWSVGGLTNGQYRTVTGYNTLSLGAPAVILMGPNFPNRAGYAPLEGSYSVLLQYFGIGAGPSLNQIGQLPSDARSISLSGWAHISLNGIDISLIQIDGGRFAGDVTPFAGSTAQLTLSTSSQSGEWLYFDDIQFSNQPIPEPSTSGLFLLGALAIGWRTLWLRNTTAQAEFLGRVAVVSSEGFPTPTSLATAARCHSALNTQE